MATKSDTNKTSASNGQETNSTTTKKRRRGRPRASSSGNKQGRSRNSGSQRKQNTLKDVFENLLFDIYNAEKQLIKALPEMAKASADSDLQNAFEKHLMVTEKQAERLEKIFKRLNINVKENTCEAMKGLIEENNEVIKEFEKGPVRDAALIVGAQKVEHYEMASYGSLSSIADVIGLDDEVDLFERTLEEEEFADRDLSKLSNFINEDALFSPQRENMRQGRGSMANV